MADTVTTTLGLTKPEVGASEDSWGEKINTNFDLVDDALDGTTAVSLDINGGTIDGAVIGGATPAAGTFTTLTANTSLGGTLSTAAQPNVTSVGTLTGLTVSGGTSLAGASTSADITFGDNDKAIFGAGSDLQIYHDGSASYINDGGIGSLKIRADQLRIESADGSETLAVFNQNSDVFLRHDNTTRLATTSTGIDVTGTVTADGLDLGAATDGATVSNTASNYQLQLGAAQSTTGDIGRNISFGIAGVTTAAINTIDAGASNSQHLAFYSGNATAVSERLRISTGGDISFYEDTGTTAKFFWDAAAESLGIGTTSPTNGKIEISNSTDGYESIRVNDSRATPSVNKRTIDLRYTGANGRTASNTQMLYLYDSNASSTQPFIQVDGSSSTHFVLNSSGNVGIGTSSPSDKLHVEGDIRVNNAIESAGNLNLEAENGSMRFQTGSGSPSERMRIDSSGNLLVGTTDSTPYNNTSGSGFAVSPIGYLSVAREGAVAFFNRHTSDGDIVQFRKNGSTVGSIGALGGDMVLGTGDVGVRFDDGSDVITPWNISTNSARDNAIDLGHGTARFDDIYATNGTIQTSDRNEKQDIEALSDAEQRVAVACKGLLRKFRWKDAVAEKGDDARIHFGIIAQDLQDAFAAEGLDAGRYAMFISSTWTDEDTGEERTRMGVRYSELLAFIIAAI